MGDQRKKSRLAGIGAALAGVAAVSAFPALFLYFRNADEADFSEALPATLVFILAGLVLFLCYKLLPVLSETSGRIFAEDSIQGSLLMKQYFRLLPGIFKG